MNGKKICISIVIGLVIIAAAGLLIFFIFRDSGQDDVLYIPTQESPAPPFQCEIVEIEDYEVEEEPETTPMPEYIDYDAYSDDYNDEELERTLPELTTGLIRWHTYPTWAFDQVFQFREGMAGVEYFSSPGIWDSTHTLGYINNVGEIVIPIDHTHEPFVYAYRGAPPFSEGRVAIWCNTRVGVGIFDTVGNLVVPFYYHWGWAFSGGLMAVQRYGYWGFIDKDGNVVIPLEFEEANDFFEGLAAVMLGGYWGFIDTFGEVIIPFTIQQAFDDGHGFPIIPRFSNGLVAVSTGQRGVGNIRWGFMDRHGNMAIPFMYMEVRDFSNGLASVALGGWGADEHEIWGSRQRWGKIDVDGNVVLPLEHDWIDPFWGDVVFASHFDNGLVVYDRYGNHIVEPNRFSRAFGFSEGLIAVHSGHWEDALWGFIDMHGNEVIPLKYNEVGGFSHGFASVSMGGWEYNQRGSRVNTSRWGFIDLEGNIVVPTVFDEVRNFSEGLAWVRMGAYWGLLQITEED